LVTELARSGHQKKTEIRAESFFSVDWKTTVDSLPDPILVIGNPPWVTNSALGSGESKNLPKKTNFQGLEGLDAITGKSNFDISESMLIRLLEVLSGRTAAVAMLCKTIVARKVLTHAWKTGLPLGSAEMRTIDAAATFNAAVNACLLVCTLAPSSTNRNCLVYPSINASEATSLIGYRHRRLLADLDAYVRWKHLEGDSPYNWRSGIKHDCSEVMELRREGSLYRNGLGELVELEEEYLYPMLKSSDLARSAGRPRRWMLVTQRAVGDQTEAIQLRAPKIWAYLRKHRDLLDRRASAIYRGRPQFSIFGVGDYSFAPWKVAISGFYKRLQFVSIGSFEGKPIVLDDTAYFVACRTSDEARVVSTLLNSATARGFFSAFLFWDAKRPITVELLRRLDLFALARELGDVEALMSFSARREAVRSSEQADLFGP
jgi:hypothetical protein